MRRKWIFIIPAALIGMTLFTFLGGEVVKLLWNWLTPSLFGWRQISFWEALGVLALCRILFGGFRLGGSSRHRWRHPWGDRWERMTPEERERFRQGMRGRWGFEPPPGESQPI